jgi:hypothetical protein
MSTEPHTASGASSAPQAEHATPDVERARVLRFIAAHRFVFLGHIRVLLGAEGQRAAVQLHELVIEGLVRCHGSWHGLRPHFQITAAGLAWIDSQLELPRFETIRDYRHDAGVPGITLAAQTGFWGETELIITEREMRAADQALTTRSANTPGFGIPIQAVGDARSTPLHYPDVLIAVQDGQVAINLQTATPGSRRVEAIINAYKSSPQIAVGLFLVEDRRVGGVIERVAAELDMAGPIHVQPAEYPRPLPALAQ